MKISQYTSATPAYADLLPFVDIDDLTMAASGTTKQTAASALLAALMGSVNVISKGADPSGSLDCTAAQQAAINAVAAAGGGIAFYPPGTYKTTPVSATVPALTVPSNVLLMGAGMGATTILKNGNGPLIDFSGVGPISKTNSWSVNQGLANLAINGNSMTGLALRLYYVQTYYEQNAKIYGNNEVAVDMAQCFDSRVINGLYLYGGSSSASAISGGQAVTHLIRNSAAPATTLSAPISGTITSLPVIALPAALQAGVVQVWHGAAFQNFTTTGAASSATSIPVTSTLVTLAGATTGDTVNGFGWSNGNTNELKMFGCHWEDQLSGAIWITAGVNNTSTVNNIRLIGSKCEQDNVGYACPQIQVDASSNGITIDHLYHYTGGFNTGFSTAVQGIYFHPAFGTLSNVDMLNGSSATISSGIDIGQSGALRPNLVNVNQYWNTSPTVGGVNFSAANVNAVNIQVGGTVTTPIANPGNASITNDNNGNWNGVGTLAIGAVSAFGLLSAIGGTDTSSTATASSPAFTSGTAKQLSTAQDVMLYIGVQTSAALAVAIGPTSGTATTVMPSQSYALGLNAIRVPKGWWVKITGTIADLTITQVTC